MQRNVGIAANLAAKLPSKLPLMIAAAALLAFFCGQAAAQSTYDERPDPTEAGSAGNLEPDAADVSLRVPCLEELSADGQVRKGVQRRPFLKRHRFELAALGGLYASDVLSSTYSYGGAASYYASEDLAIELLVTHAPVNYALQDPFSAFDRQRRFEAGSANQAMLSLIFVPMQAKFKFSEEAIFPADVFLVGGAGRTFHDSVQGLTWEAGVGMHLYLGRYFDLRLDVRDFIVPQEVLGRAHITNNLLVTMGLGLWVL